MLVIAHDDLSELLQKIAMFRLNHRWFKLTVESRNSYLKHEEDYMYTRRKCDEYRQGCTLLIFTVT